MDDQNYSIEVDGEVTETCNELPTKSSSPQYITTFASQPKNTSRYKQCYRVEWEFLPDFKDWLKPVPGEPTRAFCSYCEKSLHAHRLSLLKHSCTVRHTKAAQSAYAMKTEKVNFDITPSVEVCTETVEANSNSEEEVVDDPQDDAEPDEDTDQPPAKMARMELTTASPLPPQRSKLSTHVLDTAKGIPVGGLQVSLYKLVDSRWRIISEGFTNPDGRFSEFLQNDAALSPGRYKMHFDVDRYFELRKMESLYPFIEIVFDVKSPQDHYHIPLLLSPFGYTTYRGS